MYLFRKTYKINYNNNLFQVVLRNDNKIGFLKIKNNKDGDLSYELPSAFEFINLSLALNKYK